MLMRAMRVRLPLSLAILLLSIAVSTGIPSLAEIRAFHSSLPASWLPGIHFSGNLAYSSCSLALALAIFLLSDALGLRVIELAAGSRPGGPARFAAVFAGYALVSMLLLGEAALGLFYRSVIFGGLFLLAAASWRLLRASAVFWVSRLANVWKTSGALERACLILLCTLLLPVLLTPELIMDCFEYHFTVPQQYLFMHRMFLNDVYVHAAFSHGADLPNVIPLALGLDAAARALRPMLVIAGAAGLLSAGPALLRLGAAATVILLSFLFPGAREFVFYAKNDPIVLGCFLALSGVLVSGVLAGPVASKRGLLVAGGLMGYLASSKYLYVPLLCPFVLLIIIHLFRNKTPVRLWIFLLGAAACLLPWMFALYACHGDPLYPAGAVYLPSLFGNPNYAGETVSAYINHHGPGSFGELMASFLRMLLIGILPVLSAAPLMVPGKWRPAHWAYAAGLLSGLLLLVFSANGGSFTPRFVYPVHVAASLIAFLVIADWVGKPVTAEGSAAHALRRAILPVLAAVLGYRAVLSVSLSFSGVMPLRFSVGEFGAEEYREKNMGAYGAILHSMELEVSKTAGKSSLVNIGGQNIWDVPARVFGVGYGPPFVWRAARESATVSRVEARFRQGNVRWMLYSPVMADYARKTTCAYRWDDRMLRLYVDYLAGHAKLLDFREGYARPCASMYLFGMADRTLPPMAGVLFMPGAECAYCCGLAEAKRIRKLVPRVIWTDLVLAHFYAEEGDMASARAHERDCYLSANRYLRDSVRKK